MDAAPAQQPNHFLAKLAEKNALFGNLGLGLCHTHNVALAHFGVKAKQQVERRLA